LSSAQRHEIVHLWGTISSKKEGGVAAPLTDNLSFSKSVIDRGTKQESARPDGRRWAALTKLGDDILNADDMYDTAWIPRNISLR